MRIFVLDNDRPDLATIENALRLGNIEVLTRRTWPPAAPQDEARYLFAGWALEPATRDLVDPEGRRAELTASQFDLLVLFLRRPGRTISRDELLHDLKGRAWDYFDRSIDTLVARLRKVVDAPGAPSLIRSVRGVGYVFCATVFREAYAARAA